MSVCVAVYMCLSPSFEVSRPVHIQAGRILSGPEPEADALAPHAYT